MKLTSTLGLKLASQMTAATLVSVAALASSSAFATQPKLEVLSTSFHGLGCSDADSFASVEDNGNLELQFDNFEAVTDPARARVRTACTATLRVKAPHGYQIAPKTVTYDGQAFISSLGSGNVTARYWLGGTASEAAIYSFPAGYQGEVKATSPNASLREDSWSSCGGEANFRAMADLVSRRDANESQQSEVTVVKGAVDNKINCEFYYRRCH